MWEKEAYLNKSILDLLVPLILAAALFALFLLTSLGSPAYGTALYLKPNSYANYVTNKAVTFVYGVQNYEATDANYTLDVYYGEYLLKREPFLLKRGERREQTLTLEVNPALPAAYPVKLRLVLSRAGAEEKRIVFYWLEGER